MHHSQYNLDKEGRSHFASRHNPTHRLPSGSPAGTINIVFGREEHIYVVDDVITPEGKLNFAKNEPIARSGFYDYTYVRDVLEMRIPIVTEAAEDGLESNSP